jgi:polyisoprenoid-binding protein YceI
MRRSLPPLALALALSGVLLAQGRADEKFGVDPDHSSVSFKIQHLGLTWIHGRFNEFSGGFVLDKEDPSRSSFDLTIKTASVDTNNAKRDGHLKSPDFFNAKQFPVITFKSTMIKAAGSGYQVTGNLTLNGVTKPISFTLEGGKTAEFPKGTVRIGYFTDLTLKRSEFGMGKMVGPLGDEVKVSIGLEGLKK